MMRAINFLLVLGIVGVILPTCGADESFARIQPPIQPIQLDVVNGVKAARRIQNSRTFGAVNNILAAAQATAAPLPPAALPICKNCTTKGYDQIQIAPDVWAITEGQYWAMAVLSEKKADAYSYNGRGAQKPTRTLAIVDAPPTITKFVDAIKELMTWTGATTVTDFILSHYHKDHIAGGDAVVAAWPKARVIAQENVKQILTDGRDLGGRPIPTVTFKTTYKIDTYGLELKYHGQIHATGNIAVYHPKSKTLLFIDVAFPKWVPFKNLAVSETIPGFIKGYDVILSYDFTTIIAGHLSTFGNRADVLQGQQYVKDVMAGAQHAMANVDGTKIAADLGVYDPKSPNYGNWWYWFGEYLDACAQYCYNEISPKWLGVIGAVDVFGLGHCDVAFESVRID